MDNASRPLRILILSAEMSPFAKTGEVADVIHGLARALRELGHDVRVSMPRYEHINIEQFGLQPLLDALPVPVEHHVEMARVYQASVADGLPVYMIDSPRYFGLESMSGHLEDAERFIFYCRATLELLKRSELDWQPDVIHCHDWQTAIVPNWLETIYHSDPFYHDTATTFTIHRASHQGIFGYRVLQAAGLETYGFIYHAQMADLADVVNLLARGVYFADMVTTVSPRYAQEIKTPEFGERLDPLLRERQDHFAGILNGIDSASFDPASDLYIAAQYDLDALDQRVRNKTALQNSAGLEENPHTPLIGMVSRLTDVKGFDLLAAALEPIMANLDVQFAILGVGEFKYHSLLSDLKRQFPRRIGLWLTFNDAIARLIYAASDIYLMPSRVEPCGLGQMVAMRYGSVPIVHEVGGLADTVINYDPATRTGNGFSFRPYDSMALYTTLVRAIEIYRHPELWTPIQRRGLLSDFSWARSAAQYVEAYRKAHQRHAEGHDLGNGQPVI